MTIKRRRVLGLILAALTLITLSACQKEEEPVEDFVLPEIHHREEQPEMREPELPEPEAEEPIPEGDPEEAAPEETTSEELDPQYAPFCSLSDGKAVYWIYTDLSGALPPAMTLYAWEDLSVESLPEGYLPQTSEEITIQELRFADPEHVTEGKELPAEAAGAVLTEIGDGAFSGCSRLQELWIPDGVTRIGDEAFRSCTALSELRLPEGLEALGTEALRNCTALTGITVAGGEDFQLGEGCFRDCTALTSVSLRADLDTLPARLFEDCTSLASIELPEGLQYLSYRAFYGCAALTEFNLSQSLVYVGQYAFTGTGLSLLTLPQGLLELGDYCFANTALVSLPTLPESLSIIGAKPFEGTPAIEGAADEDGYVILSAGRKVLSEYLGSARQLTLPSDVEVIGGDCFRERDLESVFLPESVTEIGKGAFRDCTALKEVSGGAGVELIDDYAFLSCYRLSSFGDLSRLKAIGYDGFWRCGSLETLKLGGSVVEINQYAFELCDQLTVRCLSDSYASRRLKELGIPTEEAATEDELFGG